MATEIKNLEIVNTRTGLVEHIARVAILNRYTASDVEELFLSQCQAVGLNPIAHEWALAAVEVTA